MFRASSVIAAAAAAATVLVVSGCGASTSSSAAAAASSTGAQVTPPDSVRKAGELVVAMSAAPPYDEKNSASGAWEGVDVELLNAVGKLMGVHVNYVDANFDAEIPGLAAHRYDIAPNIGDFVERRTTATFVDYAQSNLTVEIASSGSFHPKSVLDLCGRTIGYENGTAGGTTAAGALPDQCSSAGRGTSTWQAFPNRAALELALRSQRIDGLAAPIAGNDQSAAHSNGQFENIVVQGLDQLPGTSAVYGMAVAKDSPLAQPLLEAMQKLAADGSYKAAFAKYAVPNGALPASEITINGSTLHKAK